MNKKSGDSRLYRFPGGMTLLEMLISMTIITMLMGAFLWMIVAGISAYQSSVGHSRNRQDLQIFFGTLRKELRECNRDSTWTQDNTQRISFSFLSARDRSGTFVTGSAGEAVWQKYIIYYCLKNTTILRRKEVYGSFSGPLSKTALNLYCDGTGTIMTKSFDTNGYICTNSANQSICSVTIAMFSVNDNGKADQQTWKTTIYLRN